MNEDEELARLRREIQRHDNAILGVLFLGFLGILAVILIGLFA